MFNSLRCFFHWMERIYAFSFLLICIAVISVGSYWYYFQNDQIITEIDPITVVNYGSTKPILSGSTVTLTRKYCLNTREFIGRVNRQYSNHIIYQVPETSTLNSQTSKGCKERNITIEIPASLPSDTYTYSVNVSYKINPIKTVTYQMPSVLLKVTNPVQDKLREFVKEL